MTSKRLFDWYRVIVHAGPGQAYVFEHLCRRNDPPPTSHGALSSNPVNFCLENSRTSDWTNRTVLDVDSTASMMRTCSFVPRLQRPYRGYACSSVSYVSPPLLPIGPRNLVCDCAHPPIGQAYVTPQIFCTFRYHELLKFCFVAQRSS